MELDQLSDQTTSRPTSGPTPCLDADATPLVVDVDGTLIRTDLLVESAMALASTRPTTALRALATLPRSRAAFKSALADAVDLDVTSLPYDPEVLALIARARAKGRPVSLVSAADARYVRAIAAHLGGFARAEGSEAGRNLKGATKAARLVELFGVGGFDYVGDAPADASVWAQARRGYVVAPSAGFTRRLQAQNLAPEPVGRRRAIAPALVKAIRPHQWAKNLLILAPALAGHAFGGPLLASFVAMISFSLCASSVYLINDLCDLKSDRAHVRKRRRPFAAGDAPLLSGLLLAPLLLAAAVGLGLFLPARFLGVLAGYFVLTLAYSFGLKRLAMIDVVTLACLYGARLLAGGAASDVDLSRWLEALAVFLFLSLALVKRTAELVDRIADGRGDPAGRGYRLSDLPMVQSMAAASGFIAVLVLALYFDSPDVDALYRYPHRLWLICVVVLYWVGRVLMKAHRGEMHDDPVVFAMRDRASLAAGLVCALVIGFSL